jgi:hypothetical protein
MRQKAYYTQNEIQTNLYTTGKQFMLTDRTEYIGLYHRYIITNEVYTLATWNKTKSKPLIQYQELDPKVIAYKNAKPKIKTKYKVPTPYKVIITPEDKKTGSITRYFIKKINNQNITEITQKQFKDFNNEKIDPNLYVAISLTWIITGEINDSKKGSLSVIGVRTKNKKEVESSNKTLPGLNKYLTNFTEFYSDTDFTFTADINQR